MPVGMSFGNDAKSDSMRARDISRNWREMTAVKSRSLRKESADKFENVRLPPLVHIEAARTTYDSTVSWYARLEFTLGKLPFC